MNTKQTFNLYVRAAMKHKRDTFLMLLLPISNVLIGVVIPYLASKILSGLIYHDQKIWTYFYVLLVAALGGLLLNLLGIRATMRLQAKVMHDLHNLVFERLLSRSASFYNNQIGGKLVSDVQDFVTGFMQLTNVGFISAAGFLATTILGLGIIFIGNYILGISLTILIIILGTWIYYSSRRRSGLRSRRLQLSKRLVSHLSDSIVNAITVKTFAKEKAELKKSKQYSEELKQARISDWEGSVTGETLQMGVLLFAQVLMIFILIRFTSKNQAVLATGIFTFSYTINLLSRFFTINTTVRQIEEVFLQASPMTTLLNQPVEIQDIPHASELQVAQGKIEFNAVSFVYADNISNKKVFNDLNISIKPGEKVGLVGLSGGGKTTLTKLLLRFDDVVQGMIKIDDQNIKEVTQTSLRKNISYVPQEPLLFHRSIYENITYGMPKASKNEIIAATKLAYAHDFVMDMPNQYDTVVGERGVKLSGGQRQRIAFARAMLKNAPILVLDEATSALDSESEALIQDALWKLMEGRTAIVIAHRLSTIQKMDRIIVLDNGKIVEEGSHKALIYQKGVYAGLWERQSGGFIEE